MEEPVTTQKTIENEKLFDSRCVARNLARGVITQAQLDAYRNGLKDVTDRTEVITIDQAAFIAERNEMRIQFEAREQARAAREAERERLAAEARGREKEEYPQDDEDDEE